MKLLLCVAAGLAGALLPAAAAAQAPDRISIVEVYGHERVSESAVRAALGMRGGDPMPTGPTGARERLLALTGIDTVDLNVVCCASDGGAIIYVGVRETGAARRAHDPFTAMLTSVYWTERNKAAEALLALTESREASVLAALHDDALDALIEMATWRHAGHALPAFIVVARVAGIDDDLAVAAFTAGERDAVLDAARARGAQGAPTEQWYFWTDDRVRHYALDIGRASVTGDTVVVLHGGWGAEHSYLIDAVAPLADRYRFVLYDQRGSLRTPAPDSTIRIDRLVADLEHLRGSLGLEQVTLVAHSMGNALAYAYLAQHPERVRGLVLVAPVLPTTFAGGSDLAFMREVAPAVDPAALAAATDSFMRDAALRAHALFQREGLIPDSLQHVPPLELNLLGALRDRDRTRAWRIGFATVNTCDGSNWRDMRGGMVYYSQAVAGAIMEATFLQRAAGFWPALREFAGPVRVVIGTCDFVDIGPAIWPHLVPALNDGGIEILDGGGHNSWMDRPARFTSALDRALRDIAGRP
jgi:proline iminopeptidase